MLNNWSESQQNRLKFLLKESNVTIAYWNSDNNGFPCNGGKGNAVYPGLIQEVKGPLILGGVQALHGTYEPLNWIGERVWIVAFHGTVLFEKDKIGGLKREILGEILLEESYFNPKISIKLGNKNLSGLDLSKLELCGSYLTRIDLAGADLSNSNLSESDISRVDLSNSNLSGCNLFKTTIVGTNFSNANLMGAYRPEGLPGWKRDNDGFLYV